MGEERKSEKDGKLLEETSERSWLGLYTDWQADSGQEAVEKNGRRKDEALGRI